MPTYEYRCANGHEFEVFQRISDKPRVKCPECGGRASRVISGGAGLIFKGSGFYITDYGKDGKGPRRDADKAERGDEAVGSKKSDQGDKSAADKPSTGSDPAPPTPSKAETKPGKTSK